ncbi:MAG TPA: SDR family NAD(P)-dependent oxidoreductase [Candidatus Cybelea sp.]|nr:SDR family NAD(P)-dependent oxidoreductase [Candidatus Cybelea sp.]
MSRVIVIVGFGPGTATAVADRFGAEGFSVALVARNEERLAAGVSALNERGITAFGFQADAADPASIRAVMTSIRSQMGPIKVLHWNAYGGLDVGDILTAEPTALRRVFDVAVFGLLVALNESLADLKSDNGAVLVSNGGFGEISAGIDEMAANQHFMGIALASAAKNKLVGLLAPRLKGDGIYVGEVTTYGAIKGTTPGVDGSIDPTRIAAEFWRLYQSRSETRGSVK